MPLPLHYHGLYMYHLMVGKLQATQVSQYRKIVDIAGQSNCQGNETHYFPEGGVGLYVQYLRILLRGQNRYYCTSITTSIPKWDI